MCFFVHRFFFRLYIGLLINDFKFLLIDLSSAIQKGSLGRFVDLSACINSLSQVKSNCVNKKVLVMDKSVKSFHSDCARQVNISMCYEFFMCGHSFNISHF